jgi:hypothetical protein
MKTKLLLPLNYVVAACVLAMAVGQAKADTFQIFNASGTYTLSRPFSPEALSGTITVDVTSGTISGAALSFPGSGSSAPFWTVVVGQQPDVVSPFYDVAIQTMHFNTGTPPCSGSPGGCHDTLDLVLSENPSTLVNDNGGLIVSGMAVLFDCGCSITSVTGVLTTPLPSALPLFATGFGALGLLGWWRKRKAIAA